MASDFINPKFDRRIETTSDRRTDGSIGPGTGRRIGKQVCIFVDDNFEETEKINDKFASKTDIGHQFIPFWISEQGDNGKKKRSAPFGRV